MNWMLTFGSITGGIITILIGIIIIIWPRLIAYIIGGYLVIMGIFTVIAALR